jgi:hypothetical protein
MAAPALSALRGVWRTSDGAVLLEIRADDTGTLEGATVRWELQGDTLTAHGKDGGDVRTLKVLEAKGPALSVEVQGSAVALQRAAAKAPAGKK